MKQKETRRFMAVFSSASFLNDLGSDMIYPIWPLFVTEFLKANMAVLGLIDGMHAESARSLDFTLAAALFKYKSFFNEVLNFFVELLVLF